MVKLQLLATVGGGLERWIGEDPPGTHGTSVETIDLSISIAVGIMIVLFLVMCFTKKK